ncbi:tRNA lysidine(34) synthetase TilS [Spiroplasma culicicola]|uniref:tRNA(Ile)-lysidine synthase n=1 Tax=Spiroplasma culicicola AES-1 TaxID=1276246 RepID=W6A5E8_9MOLU|nr:tRNA lysidine(34) synthetase TilS [Spiroplasma culicicola]AHI52353.1 tRNA(Ile)-lysidine synthase [Spiroplasma culicicola AES-1]
MKICNQKKYIAGLSGGTDSIFMLSKLVAKVKPNKIIACHVNYNYRSDSSIDQKICEEFCKKNNIKLEILNVTQNYKELRQNFESWARKIRYDFFVENLNKYEFDKILIAHNMNDDIETFIMQKQKQTIVQYWGIEKKTFYKDAMIYRPIIEYKRSQILEYLNENEIVYANDSTNLDLKYTRNKIRDSLDENNFEKISEEKKVLNQKLKRTINTVLKLVENIKDKQLDLKSLRHDQLYDQILIFKFLETNGFGNLFYGRKKATIKEIIKELYSNKSFIKIEINNLILLKDRNILKIIDKSDLCIINKPIVELSKEEIDYFNCKEEISKYNKTNIWVTNDWERTFKFLKVNNKPLNKVLTKQKKSYFSRWFDLVIYNESDKNILNINI